MTHFLMGKASRRTEKLSGVEGIDVMACRTVFSCLKYTVLGVCELRDYRCQLHGRFLLQENCLQINCWDQRMMMREELSLRLQGRITKGCRNKEI